jgi:hypothetical protein
MRTWWAPAASLFVLSPLIAEYLLGSLPMRLIGLLPIMAAMYGSGALLIREVARRTVRGWRTIAMLGLAFGIVEEGLLDQSLFNRNYLHLRLLDYGYLPALGTALPWLVFVLAIHVVWSIAVPIGFAECLFPARRERRWLGRGALVVVGLIYLGGSAMVAVSTYHMTGFVASPRQLAGATMAAAIAIAVAFALPRASPATDKRPAPAAWVMFAGSFFAGSALMGCRQIATTEAWPWPACVAGQLMAGAAFLALVARGALAPRATGRVRFALVAAGLAVYGVFGIQTDRMLHGAADLPAHVGLMLAISIAAAVAYRRVEAEDGLSQVFGS